MSGITFLNKVEAMRVYNLSSYQIECILQTNLVRTYATKDGVLYCREDLDRLKQNNLLMQSCFVYNNNDDSNEYEIFKPEDIDHSEYIFFDTVLHATGISEYLLKSLIRKGRIDKYAYLNVPRKGTKRKAVGNGNSVRLRIFKKSNLLKFFKQVVEEIENSTIDINIGN